MACSQKSEQTVTHDDSGVLTLEAWKTLPLEEKYDGATLERLRQHDEKLKSDRAWKKYLKENVHPDMKKEVWSPHTDN